jgi:multidrug resistance efflux pump
VSRYFNLFYIVLVLLAIGAILVLPGAKQATSLSFYGFAESNETEINYNYPVVVESILVTPGEEVKEGQTLLKITRIKSKEVLSDQDFKISELRSEAQMWKEKNQDKLRVEQIQLDNALAAIDEEVSQIQKEMAYKKSLVEGLSTIESAAVDYSPLEAKISELKNKKTRLRQESQLKRDVINKELAMGDNPYIQKINRLQQEKDFEISQAKQDIVVTAPMDGLIGNIYCKAAEHITSYKTLMTFYEPHTGTIKGYVHEDLTLQVDIGSKFKVSSIKDQSISYTGQVVGLGSRIVEIPIRLRKNPDFKTYGREVVIEIDKNNTFLQKEKVAISYVEGL